MEQSSFFIASKKRGLKLEAGRLLAPLTNWKIGGPARWYVEVANGSQAKNAVVLAKEYAVPIFILGGGTNILVSDDGFKGLVIKIASNAILRAGNVVWADAGVAMGRLAVFCMQNRLEGLEWATGIPGTVGGAVFGNSNCFGGSTGQSLLQGETLDPKGHFHERGKKYFQFAYDYSRLQVSGEILIKAAFKLSPATAELIHHKRKQIAEVAKERVASQPLGQRTAGSTFKAVKPRVAAVRSLAKIFPQWRQALRDGLISAGFIIDKCLHLKGFEIGGMKISEKHANFFVNTGKATAADALQLIDFVKKQCKNKLHIELEEEIKLVGDFSKK